jgi:transcriptional regulator with GAF, ATPase, and Fis domain
MKLSAEAIEALRQYDWPGNVRELANVIERAVHESVDHFKRLRIEDAIAKARGNKTKAAHALQLQPTYLSRLCKQLGIS